MKLDKAKEILDLNVKEAGNKMPPDTLEALRLSIDCLEYCAQVRRFPHNADNIPMPADEL